MSEFHLRQEATISPTICFTCQTHAGPFIDTEVEMPGHGHVWICVGSDERPGCIMQMARLAGCLDPADVRKLKKRVDDQNDSIHKKNQRIRDLVAGAAITVEDLQAAGLVISERDEMPSLSY